MIIVYLSAAHQSTWASTVNIWIPATRDRAVRTVVRAEFARVSMAVHPHSCAPVPWDLVRASAKFGWTTRATRHPVRTGLPAFSNLSTITYAPAPLDTPVSKDRYEKKSGIKNVHE